MSRSSSMDLAAAVLRRLWGRQACCRLCAARGSTSWVIRRGTSSSSGSEPLPGALGSPPRPYSNRCLYQDWLSKPEGRHGCTAQPQIEPCQPRTAFVQSLRKYCTCRMMYVRTKVYVQVLHRSLHCHNIYSCKWHMNVIVRAASYAADTRYVHVF